MSSSRHPLDTLQVASPCPASWDAMRGNDRARFCPQCRQHVYNLSALPRAAAEDLVRRTEGRLCVRFYRRGDGTVMTADCPVGLRALRRKVGIAIALAASLLLGLVSLAAGLVLVPRLRNSLGGPSSSLRQVEPMRTIMEWLDPTPPMVMGEVCPVLNVPPPPPQQPAPAPPEEDVDDL